MKHLKLLSIIVLIGSFIGFVSSCDMIGSDSEIGHGEVALQFETVTGQSSSKAFDSGNISSEHDSLIIEGSNGTLRVYDIRFIVDEFEMVAADDDEAGEFESESFFVDLPLNDDIMNLTDSEIRAGLYEELEFEVENLDLDDDSEEEQHSLVNTIREDFPEWPDAASMVMVGTYTPSDGDPQSFKVFAKAEIEIEREFEPPLEVTEGNRQHVVSVRINPADWFQRNDGSVLNLAEYDWDEQQQELMEFEAEFEDGVMEIETDDD